LFLRSPPITRSVAAIYEFQRNGLQAIAQAGRFWTIFKDVAEVSIAMGAEDCSATDEEAVVRFESSHGQRRGTRRRAKSLKKEGRAFTRPSPNNENKALKTSLRNCAGYEDPLTDTAPQTYAFTSHTELRFRIVNTP
jgi:hypothetical protein